jgi:predicted nucleotidyltransferase
MSSKKRQGSDLAPLAPLLAALRDLLAWLESSGVRGAVIGGIAASLLGRPRFTHDIDIVVLLEEEKWKEFLASGSRFGFRPRRADALAFARENRVLLIRHEPSSIDVDVSIGSLTFEKELIARTVFVNAGGLRIPLPTVEDLIIMKAVAHRPLDLEDIRSLSEVSQNLDLRRIRRWVREFSSVLEVPDILSDLETVLLRKREKKKKRI